MGINAVDASIPLQSINPVKTMGDLANAQNLQAEAGLRQAQATRVPFENQQTQLQSQQIQMALDQQKRDVDDQEKLRQHLSDPANAEAFGRGDLAGMAKLNLQPKTLIGAQKAMIDARESAAKLDASTLANNATRHTQFQQTIDGLLKLPEDQRAQAYTGALQSMGQAGILKGMNLPQQIDTSDDGLKKLAAANSVYSGIYEGAQKDKKAAADLAKTQSDTDKAAADAAATIAGIPGKTAEGGIKAAQFSAMTPEGLLPEEKVRADQAAAQLAQTQQTAKETARHNTAEERLSGGRLGVEQQREAREHQIYEATFGTGSNPALQGVEPKMRSAAAAQAQKAGIEYVGAQTAADEMKSIIDLARGGNKVAYAYAPTTGVLTINSANGTKRMNMGEIHQYASAGNAYDQVAGWLGKQTTGASIPENILQNMEDLHGQLSKNSYKTYTDKLATTNSTYRSNFNPATPPPAASLPGKPPPPSGATNLPGKLSASDVGKTYINKNGKQIRITAVNPNDGTQFQAQEVK